MAESSSGKLFLLICLLSVNFLSLVQSFKQKEHLFLLGGLESNKTETPMALLDHTICTSLPNLPEKRRAGFMGFINESLIFCGGRSESNFPISSGCWKLEKNSTEWQPSTPLPRSLSRATALAINNTLWVFGGVVEESYYQSGHFEDLMEDIDYYHEPQIQYDYYDYVIDETSHDILAYDPLTDQWTTETQMPMALQGSCAVTFNGKILLLGGKNEKISGSSKVLQFDPDNQTWSYIWPNMTFKHYNHGCTLFEHNGYPALSVGGGQSCDHESSEIVEFLALPTSDDMEKVGSKNLEGIVKWDQLPNTNHPHAYVPAMAYVNGFLYIVGGGDIGLVSHYDKIERYENGKWWSFGKLPVRAYGSNIQLPSDWIKGCSLEPNLGIHDYHQKKTQDKLKGRNWLCLNDQLILSDEDEHPKVKNGGCTVPGCHYPRVFRKTASQLETRNKLRLNSVNCQVKEVGLPSYHVECSLNCKPGWSPINGINATICNQVIQPIQKEKLTNFTMDYLECGRIFQQDISNN